MRTSGLPAPCYNLPMDSDLASPLRPLLGALVYADAAPSLIPKLLERGFESFQIAFWESVGATDLSALADELASALAGSGAAITALGVYGNTLDPESPTLASLEALLEVAPRFGAGILSCFAGRKPGASVPDSLPRWKEVFSRLAERAGARGLVLGLENCRLGDTWKTGKWNIAMNPDAWELLFEALPGAPIGLEWEPCHQLLGFADPAAQLESWAPRVVHVHGKDATVDRRALALRGAYGSSKAGRESLPGSGDSDWGALLEILLRSGYSGSVDIELPADMERGGERELEAFSGALGALASARSSAAAMDLQASFSKSSGASPPMGGRATGGRLTGS
jgi:sugar phosphate isomerase/epimerase